MRSEHTINIVFLLGLFFTFALALFARLRTTSDRDEQLAGRNLGRWLVGLSAGTTGNSGFIVTGAVGLGYVGGVHWILLPLAWLLGDLVFWFVFPGRLNDLARRARATTLSQVLLFGLTGRTAQLLGAGIAVILAVFLAGYTAAQWLAGEKFLTSAFDLDGTFALFIFGVSIVLYSALGGFRGSIYTDFFQAIVRLIGTTIALAAVALTATDDSRTFWTHIGEAGPSFFDPFSGMSAVGIVGFLLGFAFAALGFDLGQPQIATRYFAARSPAEAQGARWIYIGFIQYTWIAMTIFGALLRGITPALSDPETGLIVFAQQSIWPVATGIIFADIFATIASTSNGILVAISQIVTEDLFKGLGRDSRLVSMAITLTLGLVTIVLSFVLPGNVYSIAISAVSMIGAGVAGPMIIKAFSCRHTAVSLLASFLGGLVTAAAWKITGYGALFNEAGVGLIASLIINAGFVLLVMPRPSLHKVR